MSLSTLSRKRTDADYPGLISRRSLSKQAWLNLLTWMIILALFIAGIWMRLHLLDVPFDRDSYDEGVYWQSLRSMSTGALLYQRIFNSQPPFFLLSIYPIYALFGQTIWSARLGIAIISLFGFLGALLLGKALAGRLGMILALLLLVTNPFYLTASQTLQADGPATALALLAVGLAYLWWETPDGTIGYCLAALTGTTLALSILTKLSCDSSPSAYCPVSNCTSLADEEPSVDNILCLYTPTPYWMSGLRSNHRLATTAIQSCIFTILANSCNVSCRC